MDPKHLEQVWIEREQKQRQVSQYAMENNEPGHAAMADATKQCRIDLQYEFSLVRRIGPGPMTDAEAEEFLAQEMNSAKIIQEGDDPKRHA